MTDDVPTNWSRVLLSEVIASLDAGVSVNSEGRQCREGEIGILKTSCVSGGRFNPDEHKAVLSDERGRVRVPVSNDAIVLSRMNTPDLVGENAYVEVDRPDLFLPDRLWLLRTNDRADCRWLSFYMQSEFFRRQIDDIATGTSGSMKNISKGRLADLSVPLPPHDEQGRIAEMLRLVDAAIAANFAVIMTAEETVAMLATTIAGAPGEPLCVEDFGRVGTGRTPPPTQQHLWGGDLPFITPGDLTEGVISVNDASRHLQSNVAHGGNVLPAGSVLVTCIGSTIGKTTIARSRCATNQQINAICCPPEISGYVYLACVGLYDDLVANAGRQAVPIINKSTFARLPIARREREEMVELSGVVDALDMQMQLSRSSLDRLKLVKRQLSQLLLSGRVRVPA